MYFLDSVAKTLQIHLGAPATTNQLPWVVAWADMTTTTFLPAGAEGVTTGATPVTAIPAPASSVQRQVKYVNVFNADVIAQTVTIQVNDGSARILISARLDVGEMLVYDEHNGWQSLAVDGSIKGIGAAGPTGPPGNLWFTGSGAPSAPGTNAGDLYLDTASGDVYQWDGASWNSPIENLTGPAGTNGTNGTNGTPGNLWFTGIGAPGAGGQAATNAGDLYLNIANGDIYQASAPGLSFWGSPIENIEGPTGLPGNFWFTGSGNPNGVVTPVSVGDLYLDTATGDVYQAFAPVIGGWALLTNIEGPSGTNGNLWFTGSGAPGGSVVAVNAGDLYLDTSNGDVYVASLPGFSNWGSPIENLTGPAVVVPGSNNLLYGVGGVLTADTSTTDGAGNLGVATLSLSGEITTYAGIATTAYGVSPVYAAGDLLTQTTAQTLATYTPTVSGTFRVGGYVTITAVVTDVLQLRVTYTDENANAQTVSFFPQGLTSASLATTGAFTFPEVLIRSGAATPISVVVVFTTGIGTVTYDAGGFIEQLS